jgi:hypothetical protein
MSVQAAVFRSHRGTATQSHGATTALTAIALFAVGMSGGGFDIPERHIIGIVAWLFVLGSLPFVPRPRRPVAIVALALGALALLSGLSSLWSESAERSVLELTRVLAYLGLFLAAALTVQRTGTRRPIAAGLTLGFAGLLLMAVLSRLVPGWFPAQELQQVRPEIRPRLTYPLNYWNGVGALAAMAVPFFLYWATRAEVGARIRGLAAAALPMTGLTLYLTFSRGGLVGALLAAGVFLIASPTRWAALRPLALGLAGTLPPVLLVKSYRALNDGLLDTGQAHTQGDRVLVVLVFVSVAVWAVSPLLERFDVESRIPRLPRVRTRVAAVTALVVVAFLALAVVAFGNVGSRWESFRGGADAPGSGQIEGRYFSASGNGRYEYWAASIDAFKTRPIAGRGAGTWDYWWLRHATIEAFVRDSHSQWFDTIAELGLLGVALVAAVLGSILWLAIAALRRVRGDEAALGASLLAAIATFLVSTSIDWVWEIPAIAGTFFIIAGLAVAGGSRPGRANPVTRRLTARLGAGAAIALFAWVAVCVQALPLLSTWQLRASQADAGRSDWKQAVEHADSARSLQPWAAGPEIQLALVQRSANNYDGAIDNARSAVRREPTNWRTWLVLANIENDVGLRNNYARDLEIARSLNPRSRYWQSIGFALPPDQLPH